MHFYQRGVDTRESPDVYIFFVDPTCIPNPGGLSLEILPQKGKGDLIPCP